MPDVTGTFYAGDAFIGYGAEFQVGQGNSPETFVSVPDIESITFGDMTTGVIDITHLRSPDRHREKLGTIRDSGPITLAGNYRPAHGAHLSTGGDGFSATHNLLQLWIDVTENNFRIKLPSTVGSTVLPIRGTITRYQVGALTLDGKTGFTMEVTPLEDYSNDWP